MEATQLLHHPGLIEYGRGSILSHCTLMNGTLIGMKSMDEGKHDIVCTFLTLQPGNVTEKVA